MYKRPTARNIKISTINVRSIKCKTATFTEFVTSKKLDVVAVTETWLKKNYTKAAIADIAPPGYHFHHQPRSNEKVGGEVGVLVSDKYKTKVQQIPSYNTFEALSAEISSSSFSGLFICPYRLQENMQTFFNEFEDLLENIVTTHLDIYILGDFNLHLDVSDSNTQRFNLKQHVHFSTHVHGHWLDLLITKSSCDHVKSVFPADGISDHFAVVSEINLSAPVRQENNKYLHDFFQG